MIRKVITSWTLLLLLLTLPLLLLDSVPRALSSFSSTRVYVDPPAMTLSPNQNFTISIKIENVTDLFGWQTWLKWDPHLLAEVVTTEGGFLETGGTTGGGFHLNQSEGSVFVNYVLSISSPHGVDGSGILANVTFRSLDAGTCTLDLYDTRLFDSKPISVPTPPFLGDTNNDMTVNQTDGVNVARSLGTFVGDSKYDPNADFDIDGSVDLFDFLCVIFNLGLTYPGSAEQPVEIINESSDGLVRIGPLIQVQPGDLTVEVGERFNVSVNILDVPNFYSLQYRLIWDPEVLQVVNLYEGDFMPGRGKSYFVYGVYEEQGQVLISNTFLGPRSESAPTIDSGSLSTIEFYAVNIGSFPLNVSDTPFTQRGAVVTVEEKNSTEVTADYLSSKGSVVGLASSVLTVGPNQQYQTIQEAIDAASPNDVIHVFSGTYIENVVINKDNLTLIGESRDSTIIKAKDSGKNVISVTDVNNTKIMEFTIQDGYTGVLVAHYSNGTTIKDNIIRGNHVGVGWVGWATSLAQIKENLVGNNITGSDGSGLVVWNTEQDVIRANNITTNHIGIQKSGPFANSVICFNNIVENDYQLYPTTIDSTIQWYCTVDGNNKGNYWSPSDPDANDPYPLSNIWVPIDCDTNLDGEVNMIDITLAAIAFGSTWGDNPRWNPQVDLDKNKVVNILDIAKIAKKYGYVDP